MMQKIQKNSDLFYARKKNKRANWAVSGQLLGNKNN